MILVTHGIIGAAAGSFFSFNPWLAFASGFLSHFVLDAIPHWHYKLKSFKDNKKALDRDIVFNKNSLTDLMKLGLDGSLGLIFPILIFWPIQPFSLHIIVFAAIGGMLPDALQYVYMKFRHQPLTSLQKFHMKIHAERLLDKKPFFGISSQVLIVLLGVGITCWLLS